MGGLVSTASPNTALVVTTGKKDAKILIGGRVFVLPGVQRCDRLLLSLRTIKVVSNGSITARGVPVNVIGVCQVKISGFKEENGELVRDINAVRLAAQHFLGVSEEEINEIIEKTMEGHQRGILATMSVEDLYKNRSAFAERVREVAAEDLRNLGLSMVSYTVASVTDDEGYLTSLGVSETEQVRKNAEIGRAREEADASTKTAELDLAATVKVNGYKTQKAQSNRDLAMLQAQMDTSTGKADEQSLAARKIVKAKLQQDIVMMTERQKVMQAEEGLHFEETLAQTNKMKRFVGAEGEANASYSVAERKAAATRAQAKAEAERMILLSEAKAQRDRQKNAVELEMIARKAEIYKQYGEAAIAIQTFQKLPEIASKLSTPLSHTENMVFVDGDGDGQGSLASPEMYKNHQVLTETLSAIMGVDINDILSNMISPLTAYDSSEPTLDANSDESFDERKAQNGRAPDNLSSVHEAVVEETGSQQVLISNRERSWNAPIGASTGSTPISRSS